MHNPGRNERAPREGASDLLDRKWVRLADDVVQEHLGAAGFRLLQARLTHARKAFETIAELEPEILEAFKSHGWEERVPPDMISFFEALFERFDVSTLEDGATPAPLDRRSILKLVTQPKKSRRAR